MSHPLRTVIREHSLLWLYLLVFCVLAYGIMANTGWRFVHFLLIFFVSLSGFYFLFSKLTATPSLKSLPDKLIRKFSLPQADFYLRLLTVAVLLLMVLHIWYLGMFPLIETWQTNDYLRIFGLRNDLTYDVSRFWNYMDGWLIKAIIPFVLLYAWLRFPRWIFLLLALLCTFYAMNLLQKSHILTIFFPLLLFMLFTKKFFQAAGLFLFIVLGLMVMVFASNPRLRGEELVNFPAAHHQDLDLREASATALEALLRRTVEVPGYVAARWFECVPDSLPFQYGNGYHIVARITGHEFRNYSLELFPVIHPHYERRGISGSVNTASFIYDYINFGGWGMLLSGFVLAVILAALRWLYSRHWRWLFALNALPVLFLSSASTTTMLFSGGWALVNVLFLLFAKALIRER
jgi:hypothetical protein